MEDMNITKSDNTKGNPYHAAAGSPEGGQFVGKEEAGVAPQTEKPKTFKDLLDKIGFKKKTDEELKEAQLKKKNIDGLMKNPMFDKNKLSGATLEELQEVQNAVIVCENKSQKICDELQKYNQGATVGPWQEAKFPIDYEQLKVSGKFDAKRHILKIHLRVRKSRSKQCLMLWTNFRKRARNISKKSKSSKIRISLMKNLSQNIRTILHIHKQEKMRQCG